MSDDTGLPLDPRSPLGKARSMLEAIRNYAQWAEGAETLAQAAQRLSLIAQMADAEIKEIDGKPGYIRRFDNSRFCGWKNGPPAGEASGPVVGSHVTR